MKKGEIKMTKQHSTLVGLGVCCLVGFVLTAAGWAARPSAPAAGQVPPVTLSPNLTIGVEDGDEKLMFGRIIDLDVDGRGNIYVLDYKFRRVSVFDSQGNLLRQIAVPQGQGPREATNLGGMAVTPGGTLFINDMQKVIVYGSDGEYGRTFLVDFMISSIGCPGMEELVAIGPHDGKILHIFDAQGKLIESFGDTFTPPGELAPMKEMPMFGAPLLFNCSKDGRIFVLNPHKYEVSVFKDRKLESVINGRNDDFKPIQKMGRGFFSTAAHIVSSGGLVFVALVKPDPRVQKTADVFRAGRQIGSIDITGTPLVADPQGMIYMAEEEGFPKVVRCAVIKN
ncbi:MAG: 6-bladed beta-propeller [Candidatus Aminicenantales bacterium]